MKNGMKKKIGAGVVVATLLAMGSPFYTTYAQVSDPGWYQVDNAVPTPVGSYSSIQTNPAGLVPMSTSAENAAGGTQISLRVEELARSLENNPKLIFDYVHNHIDYEPYFGLLKGAERTLLDGAGNDADQSALMVDLLIASGFSSAQLSYGVMTIPVDDPNSEYDLVNWLGVNAEHVSSVLSQGFIPHEVAGLNLNIDRIWVSVYLDGNAEEFDPAFKRYEKRDTQNILTLCGYNASNLMGIASGTTNANYATSLAGAAIGNQLSVLASNLTIAIAADYPNSTVSGIAGGRSIVSEEMEDYAPLQFQTVEMPFNLADMYHTVIFEYGNIHLTNHIHEVASERVDFRISKHTDLELNLPEAATLPNPVDADGHYGMEFGVEAYLGWGFYNHSDVSANNLVSYQSIQALNDFHGNPSDYKASYDYHNLGQTYPGLLSIHLQYHSPDPDHIYLNNYRFTIAPHLSGENSAWQESHDFNGIHCRLAASYKYNTYYRGQGHFS